jgi:hypothetical protein
MNIANIFNDFEFTCFFTDWKIYNPDYKIIALWMDRYFLIEAFQT